GQVVEVEAAIARVKLKFPSQAGDLNVAIRCFRDKGEFGWRFDRDHSAACVPVKGKVDVRLFFEAEAEVVAALIFFDAIVIQRLAGHLSFYADLVTVAAGANLQLRVAGFDGQSRTARK